MELSTHLDFDLVAVESDDTVSLLLELRAPAIARDKPRAPAAVQVVLDRSGSMDGPPLYAAQGALDRLVTRLDRSDSFGLVAFDHETSVVVPAGPLTDKEWVREAVWSLHARGTTNLSGGYLRGLKEARRAAGARGATLLLLSDGHANEGIADPDPLAGIAARAHASGITTSTLGVGLGYDEALMAAIARGGSGNALFAKEPDAAAASIAGEVEGLLEQTVQAATLTVRPTGGVEGIALLNDLPARPVEDGLLIELGDLYAEEERKLVLRLDVPGTPTLGLAQIAALELAYVALPDLVTETVTLPVHVNVVPGDAAAGRVANPTVRTELAFQEAQHAKRAAAEALRVGDRPAALRLYSAASDGVAGAAACAPADARPELRQELDMLARLSEDVRVGEASSAAKLSQADAHRKNRKRGRRPR